MKADQKKFVKKFFDDEKAAAEGDGQTLPQKQKVIIDQKKFMEDFALIKKTKKDEILNDAFLCPHCKNLFGKMVPRHDPSHVNVDIKTGETTKIPCDAEKEYWLQKYYEDILKNIPLHVVPSETVLTDLYTKIEDDRADVDRYQIETALIVSNSQTFYSNLKCFVKKMVYDFKFKDFSYAVVTVPEMRHLRFSLSETFSVYDDTKLIILDLTANAVTTDRDEDLIQEFIYNRENKFLPIWYLSPTPKIVNNQVKDFQVRNKIECLKKVTISGAGATKIEKQKDPPANRPSQPSLTNVIPATVEPPKQKTSAKAPRGKFWTPG